MLSGTLRPLRAHLKIHQALQFTLMIIIARTCSQRARHGGVRGVQFTNSHNSPKSTSGEYPHSADSGVTEKLQRLNS